MLRFPSERSKQVHIVTGTHKGRRLKDPQGSDLRPTSARVREALLSILGPRIPGADVLDLYAGTGAVGIESLSRGAHRVVFVENRPPAVRILRKNVALCGYEDRSLILTQPVETFLTRPPSFDESTAFDVVFADPPYHTTDLVRLLECLSLSGTVKGQGMVILEHFFKQAVPSRIGALTQTRQSRYGDTLLTFFHPSSEHVCA